METEIIVPDKCLVLPDTSLCAIVRDEMMNPAGGIVDFVESTVHFVEEAVIVDTGSIDGTREKLEDLSGKYKNLRVVDRKWNGYADGRNCSLTEAKTKFALVLDADERLMKKDFRELKDIMEKDIRQAYNFEILEIGNTDILYGDYEHKIRLYERNGVFYQGHIYEVLENLYDCLKVNITIKHFVTDEDAIKLKIREWYSDVRSGMSPSQCPSFAKWKAYNPRRDEFRD